MPKSLAVDLASGGKSSLTLPNPVMVASGTFGYAVEYGKVFDLQRLGGIVTKTTSLTPRRGSMPVRIAETPAGMLNSIGLQNIGVPALLRDYCPIYATWHVPVVASILGSSPEEYGDVAAALEGAPGISGLELNISSPNAQSGGMEFGQEPAPAAAVTRAVVRNTTLPVIVKLTPNVADPRVVARAVVEAGADAVCAGNTLQAMSIDTRGRKPGIGMVFSGLSGPALKPVALRQVYQIFAADLGVPIIACGGISTAADAIEFIMAGATAVQVGTATFSNPLAPLEVVEGLDTYCEANGVSDIRELIGVAQKPRPAWSTL